MKKEKKEKGKHGKKKRIILITLLIILAIIAFIAFKIYKKVYTGFDNNCIKAVKTEDFNETKIKTELKIQFEDYKVKSAIKTITYNSKEDAQSEYERYESIKTVEEPKLEVKVKGKKLTISMPEEYLKKEVEYKEIEDINVINPEDIPYEPINQEKLLRILREQGYTIK